MNPAGGRGHPEGVAHRLTQSQQTIHMLAGAPLEQRLAAILLVLAGKVGKPWNGATLLDVPWRAKTSPPWPARPPNRSAAC